MARLPTTATPTSSTRYAPGIDGKASTAPRLAAYGGELEAAPRNGGGFAVSARMPLAQVTA